jgi:hypothetical protein
VGLKANHQGFNPSKRSSLQKTAKLAACGKFGETTLALEKGRYDSKRQIR